MSKLHFFISIQSKSSIFRNIFKILKNPLWTVCNYLIELFLILSFLSITIFTNKIVLLEVSINSSDKLLEKGNFEIRNISFHTFLFLTMFSVLLNPDPYFGSTYLSYTCLHTCINQHIFVPSVLENVLCRFDTFSFLSISCHDYEQNRLMNVL